MHETLFTPLTMGAIEARNRIFMAPLTRARSTSPGAVPNAMMETYYRQRAGAGLIISEATGISVEGLGWPGAPGIWSEEQVEGWKPITRAVQEEGGAIVLQLWHMGRLVHPDFLGGAAPVSASATTASGRAHTFTGRQDYQPARALETDEVARVVADYAAAARNAKAAGFDGVQLHGANGYLVDQFLRETTNLRDDRYGGAPENRTRFLREVLEALIGVWGASRVGVRLSPNGEIQGCDDSDPAAVFGAAARVCEDLGIAFVELREPDAQGTFGNTDVPRQSPLIRSLYSGAMILNSDFTAAGAEEAISQGRADAVSFGRPYISNPDLAQRILTGAEWAPNTNIPQSWYSSGREGYIDYPALGEEHTAVAGGEAVG